MAQDLLDKAADDVYKQLELLGGDPSKLPLVQQPIALLYTVQAIIDNGGFQYLFENDMPYQPPYSVVSDAYRQIGASDAAEAFDQAVAMFPFESPEKNQEGRLSFMETLDDSSDFVQLSNMVCGNERVWQAMNNYVQEHAGAFGLNKATDNSPSTDHV